MATDGTDLWVAVTGTANPAQYIGIWGGGTSWTNMGRPGSLVNLYIEYHDGDVFACGASSTIYRFNSGTTWDSVGTAGSSMRGLRSIDGTLYGFEQSGTARVYSWNGTSTWTSIGTLGASATVLELCEFSGTLFASTVEGKVWRYDGGTTWIEIGDFSGVADYAISLTEFDGYLWAGLGASAGVGALYRWDA